MSDTPHSEQIMSIRARLYRLAALAIVAAAASPALAQTKITAGIAAFNEALLPVYAAEEKGYFKEAGLALEFVNFKGGGPAVQAMVGGSVQLCLCAADHVVRLRARRQPAKILVGLDAFHSYALVAKGTAPYADLVGLKGKRIGVTTPGSLTDNTIRYSIVAAGLRPDRDFEIIGAGGGAAMQAAIDTGQVEAGLVITTEAVSMFRKPGAYKVVVDYRELPYPSFAALALDSWVAANRPVAKAFARAVVRAMGDLKADPALAAAVVARMYPNFPPELAADIAKSAVARTPPGGIVSQEAIGNLNDILLATDDSLKRVAAEDAFDPSLLAN